MPTRVDRRFVLGLVLLLVTLIPTRRTTSAVAYCVLGPALLFAVGLVLSRFAWGAALGEWIEAVWLRVRDGLMAPGAWVFSVTSAGICLLLGAAGATFLMERTPGMEDSATYLFQAKILASGHLAASAPPLPEFFETSRTIAADGRWYAQYPPGFPALLALGVWLGAPWLLNPILAALNAVLVHRLAREVGSELEARLAGGIAALSPFVILMSSDYTSNPASLFLATLFWLGVVIAVRHQRAWAVALAGVAGSACFAVRPYSAVAVCLVPAAVCIADLVRRRALGTALLGVLATLPALVLFGLYNLGTTGDAFVLGYTKLHGVTHTPGFGMSEWDSRSWSYQVRGMLRQLNSLNKDLLQMPFPALGLVAAAFVFRRPRFWDVCLLLSFLSLVGFHFVYHWSSLYLGPRFLFEGVFALAILSARGLTAIGEALEARPLPPARRRALFLAIGLGVTLLFPMALAARLRAVRQGYSDPTVVREVERQGLDDALVFVPFVPLPRFAACFARNTPALDGPVVFARDLGPENARLAQLHPERRAYRWDSEDLVPLR